MLMWLCVANGQMDRRNILDKKKVKNKYRSMKVGEKNDVRNYSKNGAKKLLGHYTDHNTRKRKKRDV